MLRISKLTDYATVILASLTAGVLTSAAEIAERTRIGLPTVSKLLKELQHAGLVDSVRGARGGYRLARAPALISAADIIDAVEGPVALTECAGDDGHCGIEATCQVGQRWQQVSLAIRSALAALSLDDLLTRTGQFDPPDLRQASAGTAWRPLVRS
ncbi:MAG: SUF system Fe-S cluster assembly regulator [Gammaproteobacteria bacterium]|nr:MAG: SUF system Fe-S cluster assembly regulator [Gammaproteobacteria bacterium]